MARGLIVLVALVAGGLVGLQVGPALWSVLEQIGLIATPACTDTGGVTGEALCARPRSLLVVGLAATMLCAAAAGTMAWRVLRSGHRQAPRD